MYVWLKRRLFSFFFQRLTARKTFAILILPCLLVTLITMKSNLVILKSPSMSESLSRILFSNTAHQAAEPFRIKKGKIILMTYGRSGSTLTSEIIQRDPDVFYSFEPLYNLLGRYKGRRGRSSTALLGPGLNQSDYDKESVEIMDSFLNCKFESLNVTDITNFQLRNSADSRLLWKCTLKHGNWTPSNVLDCFISTRKICLSRPVKMVKTIRLRGTAARHLMERNTDLKILYLIRDPRGTLSSQKRVFLNFKWEDVGNYSAIYCQTFREDLAEVGNMIDQYPDRVKVVRYENLAENPVGVSEEIYEFLGLNFTAEVETFVYAKTMAGQKSINAYGTSRSNSTQAANKWRTHLTFPTAQIIDNNCQDIYQDLGYIPLQTAEELTNVSLKLQKQVDFRGQWL